MPNIPGIIYQHSVLNAYSVWEVPIADYRLFDFNKYNLSTEKLFNSVIDSIVILINTYKIVYFINLPFNYVNIFKYVFVKWKSQRINGIAIKIDA